jgi:hypothetical protein
VALDAFAFGGTCRSCSRGLSTLLQGTLLHELSMFGAELSEAEFTTGRGSRLNCKAALIVHFYSLLRVELSLNESGFYYGE